MCIYDKWRRGLYIVLRPHQPLQNYWIRHWLMVSLFWGCCAVCQNWIEIHRRVSSNYKKGNVCGLGKYIVRLRQSSPLPLTVYPERGYGLSIPVAKLKCHRCISVFFSEYFTRNHWNCCTTTILTEIANVGHSYCTAQIFWGRRRGEGQGVTPSPRPIDLTPILKSWHTPMWKLLVHYLRYVCHPTSF